MRVGRRLDQMVVKIINGRVAFHIDRQKVEMLGSPVVQ